MKRALLISMFVLAANTVSGQSPVVTFSTLDTLIRFPLIPGFSGRSVVFVDYRNFTYSLYRVDIDTKQEQLKLFNTGYTEPQVRLSGDRVVWVGYPNVAQADVYVRDLQSNTTVRLTEDAAFQNFPDIQGNRAVWQDYRNRPDTNSKNADIYMYDLLGGTERRITTDSSYQSYPAVSGNRIVWQDYRNAVIDTLNADIYLYDLSTGVETQITTDPGYQTFPDIWEDKIVWEDLRNGTGDIFLYDLGTGEERAISTFPAYKTQPKIYRDWIVWQDYRNGTNQGEIWGYNLITNQEYPLLEQPEHQDFIQLDSNNIVWQDFRNGRQDLYRALLTWSDPIITLTVPNGGETLVSGATHNITWSSLEVDSVDIEYSADNGTTWVTIAEGVPASAGNHDWVVPASSTSQGRVRVSDSSNPAISDMSDSAFSIVSGLVYALNAGWNMLSLPLSVPDASVGSLFPEATSPAYSFDGGYVQDDTLRGGVGYWLKFPSQQSPVVGGEPVVSDTIPVQAGWNIIGSVSHPVPVSSVASEPEGIIASQFFGYDGGYFPADTLHPGQAYWVKIGVNEGELILPATSSAGSRNRHRIQPLSEPSGGFD